MAKYYSSADDDLDVDEDAVDTGLIRCVCSSSEDDGFTIQCERCLVWQHAFCVRVSQNNIPEHYLCDQCERKFTTPYSSANGNKFGRYSENHGRSMDKESRPKSDGQLYNSNTKKRDDKGKGRVQTDKHHFRDIYNRVRHSADEDDDHPSQSALPSPASQQQIVQQQQQQQQKRNPVGRPPSKKPKLSKRISVPKRSLPDLSESERVRRKRKTTNTSSSRSPERFEHISQNRLRSKHVQQVHRQAYKEACERWSKQGQSVAARSTGVVFLHDLQPIAETSIRPLPKSLYNSLQRDKKPRKGLFAESRLPANQFVTVLLGDVFLKSEYKFDPTNDFALLGTSCSHVFFYPTLDLCIDARHRGNDARHVRRSCQPNAEVRPIVLPHAENDASVHLGVFTRDSIEPGEELTIGWNWQKGHISWKKNLEWHDLHRGNASHHHQVIDEEEERGKRALVLDMLKYFSEEIGDCACDELDLCFIEHLKKEARGYSSAVEPWLETSLPLPTRKLAKLEASTASGGSTHSTSSFPTNHSRASSRQSIVARGDTNEKGTILESGEDIDIVSTSPLVQSPRIQQQQSQAMPSETEEELDIDGDIDVDDAPSNKGSGTRRTSVSSQSTLSTVSDPTGKAKAGKPAKLPCKKIWMRSFMHHNPSPPPPPPPPQNVTAPAVSVTPEVPEHKTSPVDEKVKPESSDMQVDQNDNDRTLSRVAANGAETTTDEPKDDDVEMEEAVKEEVTQPKVALTSPALAIDNKSSSTTPSVDAPTANVSVESPTKPDEPQAPSSTPEADASAAAAAAANEKKASVHADESAEKEPADEDLDDGAMSDASSASTIPLDDEERKARQEELARPVSPFRDSVPPETETAAGETTAAANEADASDVKEATEASDLVAEAPDAAAEAPDKAEAPAAETETETETKTETEPASASASAPAPAPAPSSPSRDSSSENRPPLPSKPSPSDASSSTMDAGSEAKPVKVKLSLQEYLSRRAANQSLSVPDKEKEDPSTSSSTTADHPSSVQGSVCNGLPVSDSPMDKDQPSEAIVNQH